VTLNCLERRKSPNRSVISSNSVAFRAEYVKVVESRVHTGQGKLEKVREFDWSGKVRENAKVTGKSEKFGGKFYFFVQLL